MSLNDEGNKHTVTYRTKPMYVFVGKKAMSISMVKLNDEEHTLEALDIISSLTTMLLEKGVEKELISGKLWECSRRKNSLGASLSRILVK